MYSEETIELKVLYNHGNVNSIVKKIPDVDRRWWTHSKTIIVPKDEYDNDMINIHNVEEYMN